LYPLRCGNKLRIITGLIILVDGGQINNQFQHFQIVLHTLLSISNYK
jgi:hypothetical protein